MRLDPHPSSKLQPGDPMLNCRLAGGTHVNPAARLAEAICCPGVVLGALCISGWGAFGYKSWSSAAAGREKLALITASEAARRDLGSELKRLRDRVGDLRAVQGKLAATREELKRTTTAREDAAGQLVGFQREVAAISSRLEKATKIEWSSLVVLRRLNRRGALGNLWRPRQLAASQPQTLHQTQPSNRRVSKHYRGPRAPSRTSRVSSTPTCQSGSVISSAF